MNSPPSLPLVLSDADKLALVRLGEYTSTGVEDAQWDEIEGSQIDLREIWAAIYRNRWRVALIICLALAGGVASILLTRPTYTAQATIQIDQQTQKVLGTEEMEPIAAGAEADRFLQTQVDIMKSRAAAIKVGEDLNLFNNTQFLERMGGNPATDMTPAAIRNRVADALQSNVKLDLPRTSRVVRISFDSVDPALAAQVANSYAATAITNNLQRKFNASAYSRRFLSAELDKSKVKLESSERALIDYARSARLIDASTAASSAGGDGGPRSLTTAELVQANESYAGAKTARMQAQGRWERARGVPAENLPEVLSNQAYQQLKQQLTLQRADYEEKRQRLKASHPLALQSAARMTELQEQITALTESIRSSLREQYQVAQRQESALSANLGQLKGSALSEQDRSVQYNILKREADTNRELYNALLQRFKELSAEAGVTSNNISIVDTAEVPTAPTRPRPLINMAVAGLLGLLLAGIYVVVRLRLDDLVRTPKDVSERLHLPIVGILPQVEGKETPLQALEVARSSLSESIHSLRTSLELATVDGAPRTLVLTSSHQGEGKSTTCFALAREFAKAGNRVLLIDGDLRRPSIHNLAQLDNDRGFANVLAGQVDLDEVIRPSSIDNLSVLVAGPPPPDPALLLGSASFNTLLAMLKSQYDFVLIDGPPVMGLSDAIRLCDSADGTLLVIEANDTHLHAVRAALARLRSTSARIVGVVLTKYSAKAAGYGEGYEYYGYYHGD